MTKVQMYIRYNILNGKRFGQYLVIRRVKLNKKRSHWLCKCSCGNKKIVRVDLLKRGRNANCGCQSKRGRQKCSKKTKLKLSIKAKEQFSHKKARNRLSAISRKLWKNKSYCSKQQVARSNPDFIKKSRNSKLGSKNPMFGVIPNYNGFGNCKSGWIRTKKGGKFFYRSSWEKHFAKLLDKDKLVGHFTYEPFGISYWFNGREATYFPDFLVKLKNGIKLLVEIKAKDIYKFTKNRCKAKFKAAEIFCKMRGIKFKVITSISYKLE